MYSVDGYKSSDYISPEYKVNYLARMLAGYDDQTWGMLRPDRKRTYERAASMLLHGQQAIIAQLEEWNAFDKTKAADIAKRHAESAPRLQAEIERIKEEIQQEYQERVEKRGKP